MQDAISAGQPPRELFRGEAARRQFGRLAGPGVGEILVFAALAQALLFLVFMLRPIYCQSGQPGALARPFPNRDLNEQQLLTLRKHATHLP